MMKYFIMLFFEQTAAWKAARREVFPAVALMILLIAAAGVLVAVGVNLWVNVGVGTRFAVKVTGVLGAAFFTVFRILRK